MAESSEKIHETDELVRKEHDFWLLPTLERIGIEVHAHIESLLTEEDRRNPKLEARAIGHAIGSITSSISSSYFFMMLEVMKAKPKRRLKLIRDARAFVTEALEPRAVAEAALRKARKRK